MRLVEGSLARNLNPDDKNDAEPEPLIQKLRQELKGIQRRLDPEAYPELSELLDVDVDSVPDAAIGALRGKFAQAMRKAEQARVLELSKIAKPRKRPPPDRRQS